MTTIFSRHSVADYATWKRVYDEAEPLRLAGGVTNASVYRDADDPGSVIVVHHFRDLGAARAFASADGLRAVMVRAGVTGNSTFWFGDADDATAQNKTISRMWYEDIFNAGHLELADQICAADYTNIDPYGPSGGWPKGPAGTKAVVSTYRAAFPDLKFTIENQVAEGDAVVTRWTARGTNTGPLPNIPATGKAAVVTGISIERFADGKLVESQVNWDFMGMLEQLGVIPAAR